MADSQHKPSSEPTPSPPPKKQKLKWLIGMGLGLWLVISIAFGLFVMFFSVWILESCVGLT